MKPVRSIVCLACAYTATLAAELVAPRFDVIVPAPLHDFSLGALSVGLAVTLALVVDHIRVNRRLQRMTAPMAESAQQDFESLGRDPRVLG